MLEKTNYVAFKQNVCTFLEFYYRLLVGLYIVLLLRVLHY